VSEEFSQNWGTHTIPQFHPDEKQRVKSNSLWTSGKPPLTKDTGWKSRNAAKQARNKDNRAKAAEENQARANGDMKWKK